MRFAGQLCKRARPGPGNAVTRQHTKSEQQKRKGNSGHGRPQGNSRFAAFGKREIARWTRIIKAAGVGAE
jgi:hypothetical protein